MSEAAVSRLPPLQGHDDVRVSLARAARESDLPGSLLLHGPPGVGKQRLGLWLARLRVCRDPLPAGPCGECRDCRLALRLEHPDIHWFFPLPRPKRSGGLEKLAAALEDARADALAERRAEPYHATATGEPAGLYLAQIHTIRRLATNRPAMGSRKVFVIGDAERLVPQESSPAAANALLKLLEEPPEETTFVLTAGEPDALLPTMRSRLLPVRLRALPEDDVARFLIDTFDTDDGRARTVARLSQGAIGRALGFLSDDAGDPGPLEALRQRARGYLAAAAAPASTPRLSAAHDRRPTKARGEFSDVLDFLTLWLRDLGATGAGAPELVVNRDADAFLARLAERLPAAASAAPAAIRTVEEARTLAHGNVNPQLTLAWLLRSLHQTLAPDS